MAGSNKRVRREYSSYVKRIWSVSEAYLKRMWSVCESDLGRISDGYDQQKINKKMPAAIKQPAVNIR